GHAGDGGDGRSPLGARGDRSQARGTQRRSKGADTQEGHGRSRETFQRRRSRRAHRICKRRKPPLFPGRPPIADFADSHRAVPQLRSSAPAGQQQERGYRARGIERCGAPRLAACRPAFHAVKLAVSNEGIEISASSPEYGEAKESIEKEFKGEPIAIGFNSSYMLDFLGAAADGPISIELKDEQSAGQMRPLADESYRYRYIIMPMRI